MCGDQRPGWRGSGYDSGNEDAMAHEKGLWRQGDGGRKLNSGSAATLAEVEDAAGGWR